MNSDILFFRTSDINFCKFSYVMATKFTFSGLICVNIGNSDSRIINLLSYELLLSYFIELIIIKFFMQPSLI